MFMLEFKTAGWWYWLVTALLLTLGAAGFLAGFVLAIGVTVFQLIYYGFKLHSVTAFPVQVRFFYLLLLLAALPEAHRWLFWLPLIGTWAQVLLGYCLMARCVSLFPWNREGNMTRRLIVKTFFSRPVKGSLQQGVAEADEAV